MKNLMPKVAELLGVEIGEEFEISKPNDDNIYKITHVGLEYLYYDKWFIAGNLGHLLSGQYKIIKKPWKPKYMNRYYFIYLDGVIGGEMWAGGALDILRYKTGNCFKTKEEITPEIIDKHVKFYADDTQVFNVLEE